MTIIILKQVLAITFYLLSTGERHLPLLYPQQVLTNISYLHYTGKIHMAIAV